eukprot:CAMPEP_0202876352 /NCGR_PEP_ID=MMETSP1391-20130828/28850_1 /ASSEMBLY_ACC=CAM_ASM_000867 /TAXON_ID=1034604 /ORGANISM="Chlamydomonas leiostraca, Strain SAG 11-49" /LENGTH=109 /DNA_ID=CAMNT_0049558177 /DNA_START=113 /DNA_END=438 /DNA_ORIENTATION=-
MDTIRNAGNLADSQMQRAMCSFAVATGQADHLRPAPEATELVQDALSAHFEALHATSADTLRKWAHFGDERPAREEDMRASLDELREATAACRSFTLPTSTAPADARGA